MSKSEEIKRILLGRITTDEDGMLEARPKGTYTQVNGLVDGYFSVLLFGVMSRTRTYLWKGKKGKEAEIIKRYVQQLGRLLSLKENPDAIACFTGRMVLVPTVVEVDLSGKGKNQGRFCVTVNTGRTPFGILRCLLVHYRFQRLLGELGEYEKPEKKKK